MKKLTKNSGITLIALVITIIVLLILAGVTIMSVTGENGILSRSISAREETKKAQALEELKEKIMEVQIDKKGDATLQDIIDALQSDTENSYTVSTELATITGATPDLTNKSELYILYKDYWFKINSKLEVSFVKDSDSNDNNIEGNEEDEKEEEKEDENVVKISDKASLEKFRDNINKGEKYENKTITLTADIDLQGSAENQWTPIGNIEENAFTGTFDGAGYKITNIYIDTTDGNQGLFGYNKGTIENVGMESGTIKANGDTGSIAGYNSGRIEKCYNKIDMECIGGSHFGGIVGLLENSGTVSKCYNAGNLQASNMNNNACLAGIAGWSNTSDTTIEYCYNTGNITNNANTAKDNVRAVGISDERGFINSCYNTGTITLDQTGNETMSAPVASGICGQINSTGRIYNCYNIGETKIIPSNKTRNGSIVGYDNKAEIKNCFCWCSEGAKAIGQVVTGATYDITEKTNKEEMKSIAEQLGDDYVEDTENINGGYPILAWQVNGN